MVISALALLVYGVCGAFRSWASRLGLEMRYAAEPGSPAMPILSGLSSTSIVPFGAAHAPAVTSRKGFWSNERSPGGRWELRAKAAMTHAEDPSSWAVDGADRTGGSLAPTSSGARAQLVHGVVDAMAREGGVADVPGHLRQLANHKALRQAIPQREWEGGLRAATDRLCGAVEASLVALPVDELCKTLNGVALLSACNPLIQRHLRGAEQGLMAAIGQRVTEPATLHALTAKQASNVIWAFAKVRVRHDKVLQLVGQRLMSPALRPQVSGRDVSVALWGLGKVHSGNWVLATDMAAYVAEEGVVDSFDPKSIALAIWACATLQLGHHNAIEVLPSNPFIQHTKEQTADGWSRHSNLPLQPPPPPSATPNPSLCNPLWAYQNTCTTLNDPPCPLLCPCRCIFLLHFAAFSSASASAFALALAFALFLMALWRLPLHLHALATAPAMPPPPP